MPCYVKLLKESECHNGFQYKTGLNVDTQPWNGREGEPGGLHICEFRHAVHWLSQMSDGEQKALWFRSACIPQDALAVHFSNQVKVSRVMLSERRPIRSLLLQLINRGGHAGIDAAVLYPHALLTAKVSSDFILLVLERSGDALRYVKEPTYEMCLAAVRQDGLALRYVKEPHRTHFLFLAAVRQNGFALKYVKPQEQTRPLCLSAVQQNDKAVEYVKDQTIEVFQTAIWKDGFAYCKGFPKNAKRARCEEDEEEETQHKEAHNEETLAESGDTA